MGDYLAGGLTGPGKVEPGRDRNRSIDDAVIGEIVEKSTNTSPPGRTHWSARMMAADVGASKDTVKPGARSSPKSNPPTLAWQE